MKNLLENSIRLLSSSRILLPLSINVDLPPASYNNKNSKQPSNSVIQNQSFSISNSKTHERMSFRIMGLDSHPYSPLDFLPVLHNLVDGTADQGSQKSDYVRDQKAMASTPADVKEYPNAYAFIIDMPGLKSGDIKVQVEENVLVISGERKREEEKEGAKFVRMERRVGKFMRKFVLPENANTDAVSAVCQDGVLTVTVQKLPPPEPKKPKTIEVKIA